MNVNISLLSKALPHINQNSPAHNETSPSLELQLPSKLVFPSPEFTLDEKDEDFLTQNISRLKLSPNLTLLDFLFFDLYRELTVLQSCVNKDDFENARKSLEEAFVATLADENNFEPLMKFLQTVIRNFICFNNAFRRPTLGTTGQIQAIGETKLITDSLYQRVQLFKKFLIIFSTQSSFSSHPIKKLMNANYPLIMDNHALHDFVNINCDFMRVILNALRKTDPDIDSIGDLCLVYIDTLQSVPGRRSDLDQYLLKANVLTKISSLFSQSNLGLL